MKKKISSIPSNIIDRNINDDENFYVTCKPGTTLGDLIRSIITSYPEEHCNVYIRNDKGRCEVQVADYHSMSGKLECSADDATLRNIVIRCVGHREYRILARYYVDFE